MPSLADKYPLAYSLRAVQCSVTQSTPCAVTFSGCLLLSLHSFSSHRNQQHQQAQAAGGQGWDRGVMCIRYYPRIKYKKLISLHRRVRAMKSHIQNSTNHFFVVCDSTISLHLQSTWREPCDRVDSY